MSRFPQGFASLLVTCFAFLMPLETAPAQPSRTLYAPSDLRKPQLIEAVYKLKSAMALWVTHLSRVFTLAALFFLLWPATSVAQDIYRIPPESRRVKAEVRGSVLLLRDAIRRGDVPKIRRLLDGDYIEGDVISGRAQAIQLISELLDRAAVRPTPAVPEGRGPGSSAHSNRPPFWDFDLTDLRIVAVYGDGRASVTCQAVMHALRHDGPSGEQEIRGGARRAVRLELERRGSRWLLRSSDSLLQFLEDAVGIMESR